jgi:hypothetical protein
MALQLGLLDASQKRFSCANSSGAADHFPNFITEE